MKRYFINFTNKPRIILNAGGFSSDCFITADKRNKKYKILRESLSSIEIKGCEILPQTMPPYPWHFGGQRFHNLFIYPDEIISFSPISFVLP